MSEIKQSSVLSRPLVAYMLAAFCAVLWGSAAPSIKLGYELFEVGVDDTAANSAFAGVRFILAGLLVLGFRLFQARNTKQIVSLTRRQWLQVMLLSLFQTIIHYYFFYVGVSYTSGAKSAILNSSSVFFSALLAHSIYSNDKISLKKGVGMLVGFLAVILVNLDSTLELSFKFQGEGFVLIASFLNSTGALYSKRISRKLNPVLLTGLQLTLGGVVLLLIGLFQGAVFPISGIKGYFLLLYMALLSSMAFSIWTTLLKYNKVSSITIFFFLIPIVGTLLSALMLNESVLRIEYLLALGLVVTGIILVTHVRDNSKI